MASRRNKQRTYARHRVLSRTGRDKYTESDGQYLLKLVIVLLLGTVWLKFAHPMTIGVIPLSGVPVGMIAGLILVSLLEKSQNDRKIWYAILILVTIISYFVPSGIIL